MNYNDIILLSFCIKLHKRLKSVQMIDFMSTLKKLFLEQKNMGIKATNPSQN